MTRFLKIRLTKRQKLKASFGLNGSTVRKRRMTVSVHVRTPFSGNVNPLEKDYSNHQKLLSCGLKTEKALSKMKLSKPPPSGEENNQCLLDLLNHENMCIYKDFLRWYNNIDVVTTLEAMQKMLVFHHKTGIDMLKLGCKLPNSANICLHKSTSAKFYPFTETDKNFLQKI